MSKKFLFIFPSLLPLIISCTSDELDNKDIEISTVNVQCQQLEYTDGTRSKLDFDGEFKFSWAEGDVIGICPSSGGDQLSFQISQESVGEPTAVFDGGGWRTKPSSTYTAYSPLNRDVYISGKYSKIPLIYVGQTQSKNNSTAHLGAYDYMVSPPTQVSGSGGITFKLKRISSIVFFDLTLPEPITATQLKLACQELPFITKGTFDAQSGSTDVTPVETSNEMTLYLDNIATDSNNNLKAYMLICPSNFDGKQWTLSVLTDIREGKYYEYKLSFKAINWTANLSNILRRPRANLNEAFEKVEHPASEYPYPPKDGGVTGTDGGVTGTVPDFDVEEVN